MRIYFLTQRGIKIVKYLGKYVNTIYINNYYYDIILLNIIFTCEFCNILL